MMTDVIVRTATLDDIGDIQRLYREVDRYHAELLPEVFQPVEGDARPADVVAKSITDEDADYLVASLFGEVVGFVNLWKRSYPSHPMFMPRQFAQVENAVVSAPYRGRGIGTALFDAAVAWAKEKGLRSVQLSVWTANERARRFYLERGFVPITEKLELDLSQESTRHGTHAEPTDAAVESQSSQQ